MVAFQGIDLGTTSTLIGRAREDGNSISVTVLPIKQRDGHEGEKELSYLPSVAYFPENGDPMVGLEAEVIGPEEDASRFVRAVKRQMGHNTILPVVDKEPYEVSALYLSHALKECKRSSPIRDTIFTVTVPASFTTNQRTDTLLALRKACEEIGFPLPKEDEGQIFISEPVAAMLAFLNKEISLPNEIRQLDLSKANRVIVYDIGGGTLDLTVVFVEPCTPEAEVQNLSELNIWVESIGYYNPFGGEDFDRVLGQELYQLSLERYPELRDKKLTPTERLGLRLQFMNIAKKAKEDFSEEMISMIDDDAVDFLEEESEEPTSYYRGDINVDGLFTVDGDLTETQYRDIVKNFLTDSTDKNLIKPLKDLLTKEALEPNDINGLLIVGGSARLPLITQLLKSFWGNENVLEYDPPDHAVVTGAAICSYLRFRYNDFSLDEPAADSYYVQLKDKFDLILPAREKRGEIKEYKLPDDTDRILFQIFAGEEPKNKESTESIYQTLVYQGATTIALGKEYKKGTLVWVQMLYDGVLADDRSKVPWIYIWIDNKEGDPLFRRRYSEFIQEERDGQSI